MAVGGVTTSTTDAAAPLPPARVTKRCRRHIVDSPRLARGQRNRSTYAAQDPVEPKGLLLLDIVGSAGRRTSVTATRSPAD